MQQQAIAIKFHEALQSLVGQPCWGIVAGEGTGSIVQLYFGKKILRERPVNNPHLTKVQQSHEAEFTLLIECTWRLDSDTEIICGSGDDNLAEGDMVNGLKRVVGQSVNSISLVKPAFDLVIEFSSHTTLRAFCDQLNPVDQEDNYNLFLANKVFIVGNRSKLRIEERIRARRRQSVS